MRAEREQGEAGLASHPHPGPSPKLTAAQWAQLPLLLQQGAEAHGFRGEVWTTPRVAAVIAQHFGVTYHPAHVGRLLAKLGWSRQKPVKRDLKRDEGAVATFQKEEFPAVKRGQTNKEAPSSSSMRAASTPFPR